MKSPIVAICTILALAVGSWGLKRVLDHPTAAPTFPVIHTEAVKPALAGSSAANGESNKMQTGLSSRGKASSPVFQEPKASQTPVASSIFAPRATPAKGVPAPATRAPISSGLTTTASIPQSTTAFTRGWGTGARFTGPLSTGESFLPSTIRPPSVTVPGASPSTSGAGETVLEVDPGVPLPAALLQADGESSSPIVAAARQQISDSFMQEVDNSLSQPETANSDNAVNEAYFESLTAANEQYRALYGEAAYNQKTMQASLEAMSGK